MLYPLRIPRGRNGPAGEDSTARTRLPRRNRDCYEWALTIKIIKVWRCAHENRCVPRRFQDLRSRFWQNLPDRPRLTFGISMLQARLGHLAQDSFPAAGPRYASGATATKRVSPPLGCSEWSKRATPGAKVRLHNGRCGAGGSPGSGTPSSSFERRSERSPYEGAGDRRNLHGRRLETANAVGLPLSLDATKDRRRQDVSAGTKVSAT